MKIRETKNFDKTIAEKWKNKPVMVHTSDVFAEDAKHQINGINKHHTVTNGWDFVGYSYLIERDGTIWESPALKHEQCHCRHGGQNRASMGICFAGKGDTQAPSLKQMDSLKTIINAYKSSAIVFHCDFNPAKSCPGNAVINALEKDSSTAKLIKRK